MPYYVPLLPVLAFFGIVGAVWSLVRGRRRSALAFGIVGVASAAIAITLYYASI